MYQFIKGINKNRQIMKLLISSFVLIISISLSCFSQDRTIIKGVIYDSKTGVSVPGAHVIDIKKGTGTTSDNSGKYQLVISTFPIDIEFSHISYEKKILRISDKKQLNTNFPEGILRVYLDPLDIKIDEVVVKGIFKKLLDKEPFHIVDFQFYDDNIVLVGHRNNNIFRPELIITDIDGKLLSSIKLKSLRNIFKAGGISINDNNPFTQLFKDCFGNIHLVERDSAYQVLYKDSSFQLMYGISRQEFNDFLFPARIAINNSIFFEEISKEGQSITYFLMSRNNAYNKLLKIVGEKNRDNRVKAINRALTEAHKIRNDPVIIELTFQKLTQFQPVYSYIFSIEDSICLFDFWKGSIDFYNHNGFLISHIPIDYHKDKDWQKNLIIDEITSTVYNCFENKNLKLYLKEINLQTGKPVKTIIIPDLKNIENIQVRDNIVYFLYQPIVGYVRKKLYTMRL